MNESKGLWESVSTGLAERVPKNSTREKSTMVGVNPGELLCASTSHNKEIVSLQFPFWKADY
jgi:hypothetical protein